MSNAVIFSFGAVLLVSLMSLIGLSTISVNKSFLKKIIMFLVSLAAGTLIGDVFFHILPELFEEVADTNLIMIGVIIGIMTFFFLEKILHWHHCHQPDEHNHMHPVAINNLFADGLHNLIDGTIIASSFSISTEIGIATTIAVILHEIPQEIGDFGVLIHSGLSRRTALFFNFLSASLAFLGAGIAFVLGDIATENSYMLLSFAGGGFIYLAIADLFPELKVEDNLKKSIIQFLIVVLGIVLMFGLQYLE
ncbi:ZIP family metal transporter [Candidatus Dojkabacteria bacterium]|uniref:ZIP family metal transporter n=1 Tax=Candidatus Dojkabacteria bacterium TaxID=2099670 RepID=A0A955LC08_9BACT|nr:ZIP family metal transporter [Candidatus Dojkabacteria bacterium]